MTQEDVYHQLVDMAKRSGVRYSLSSSTNQQSQTVDEFKQLIAQVRQHLSQITDNNQKILNLREKLVYNTSADTQKETNDSIYGFTELNSQTIKKVRKLLEQIGILIQKARKEYPDEPQTMSKIYQKNFLLKEVQKITRQAQKIQVLYDKWSVGTQAKRIKLLDPSLTDKEAEAIAAKDNGYEKFLVEKTLGKGSLKLKYRVDDIKEKYQQVRKLQKSIAQNLSMMKQIAFMVQQQGEMIDSIQSNVLNARDYIQKATVVLHKEKEVHQKSRKKMCCIIFIGLVILALIAVPIIVTQLKKNSIA